MERLVKLNYFVVGTNDLGASKAFYDALFAGEGLLSITPSSRMTYWIGDDFAFASAIPFDTKPATIGNGTMAGFGVRSKEEVEKKHALAISLGGICEGMPGQRGPRFSAYVRDLDGNKLCFASSD